MSTDRRPATEDYIVKMLRRRKVRRNVARAAIAEHLRTEHKAGEGSLADSLVITARMHRTPGYRKAVRRANRAHLLIRLGLRKPKPARPLGEIFAELDAERRRRGLDTP